jgi:ATP-dependent DNA ligase
MLSVFVQVVVCLLQVIYIAFDLIYLNGASLLRTPLSQRRQLLHAAFHAVGHTVSIDPLFDIL